MPRPLLSCVTCRKRKVRCGREQPTCGNCVGANEPCRYENPHANLHRSSTSQANASTSPENSALEREERPEPNLETISSENWASLMEDSTMSLNPDNVGYHAIPAFPEWPNVSLYSNNVLSLDPGSDVPPVQPLLSASNGIPFLHEGTASGQDLESMNEDLWRDHGLDFGSANAHSRIRAPGHFSIGREGRHRYVGSAFWCVIQGNGSDEKCRSDDQLKDFVMSFGPEVDTAKLAEVSESLPPKLTCDALLFYFMVGVRPLYPFVHIPTFQNKYQTFWKSDRQRSGCISEDPTFLCLLIAVLYCGATTTTSGWKEGTLLGHPRDQTIDQLRLSLAKSLEACDYQEQPTMNTLVAVLISRGCTNQAVGAFGYLQFLSMVVRMAESMGIHRDGVTFGLDPVTCELRRRIWWHIVSLDVQATICKGSQPVLSGPGTRVEIPMASEMRDQKLESYNNKLMLVQSPRFSTESSIVMLLAVGRFETARFQHFLICELYTRNNLDLIASGRFRNELTRLHEQLDSLILRMPVRGIPERGLLPFRLINSSPRINSELYDDDSPDPTVLASWARIMLTMAKSEASILFHKSFLVVGFGDLKNDEQVWESVVNACIVYLQSFLQVIQTPAFSPWAWYYTNYYAPVQCIYIILTYLTHYDNTETSKLAQYFADEVIEVLAPEESQSTNSDSRQGEYAFTTKLAKQMIPAWNMIISMRNKIHLDVSRRVDGSLKSSVSGYGRDLNKGQSLETVNHGSALFNFLRVE